MAREVVVRPWITLFEGLSGGGSGRAGWEVNGGVFGDLCFACVSISFSVLALVQCIFSCMIRSTC